MEEIKVEVENEKTGEIKEVEQEDFLKYLVGPHGVKSREVEEKDIERVINESHIMLNLCFCKIGMYPGGEAVAHSQINKEDPLRFFVLNNGNIIINPVISRHTNSKVTSKEGCLDFPNRLMIDVDRYWKIEIDYKTFDEVDGKTVMVDMHTGLKGKEAFICQHELDHFEGRFIYRD
jgi:peptide deformylase